MNIGTGFGNPNYLELKLFPLYLGPLLCLIGVLICLTPTLFNPKYFSTVFKIWVILGAIYIAVTIIYQFLSMAFLPEIFWISNIISDAILVFLVYVIVKDILTEKSDKKEPSRSILEVITKPQKVTEEEVSISKERRTCLVCKGKLGGFMFMCFECGAYYCDNCVCALSEEENMCWVCTTPLDQSKKVKFTELEQDNVVLEDALYKKGSRKK